MKSEMGSKGVQSVITALLMMTYTVAAQEETQDYCEDSGFRGQCPPGQVIIMQEARYGRMELGTCLKRNYGSMGCYNDVMTIMDKWCSGRQTCEVDVSDLLEVTKPCPPDLRSYLQARYTCVPVANPSDRCCHSSVGRARVESSSGYIASSITEDTGCGSIDCPWLLQAPKGQRFNISVFDFGVPIPGTVSDGPIRRQGHGSVCFVYAIIKEEAIGSTMTLCAGDVRRKHVYTTSTNSVEIRIVTKKREGEEPSYFMIDYEAFGCPDPTPPVHGFMERKGARATLGCPSPDDITWEITCRDGKWHGYYGNCSAAVLGGPAAGGLLADVMHLSPDVSIVIITIVAIFIAMGILVTGVVCLKRHWGRRSTRQKHPETITGRMNSRDTSYSAKGDKTDFSSEAPVSRGHNYLHTWELPRQLPRTLPQPEPDYEAQYYTDHIYESPTYERGTLHVGREDVAKYYELDPEAEPFNPGHCHRESNANDGRLVSIESDRYSYPTTNSKKEAMMSTGSYTS